MKKLLVLLVLLFPRLLFAQQNSNSQNTIPESYYRNSLTVVFLDQGGNHWSQARQKAANISFSDKYDNNNLSGLFMQPSFSRGSLMSTAVAEAINSELEKRNIGRDIIAKWYNRQPDGTMDVELVHQRGRFTATDADYMVASSTRRGDAALEDLGNKLVNKSYVLVLDVYDIKSMSESDEESLKGWRGNVTGYLYRVNFDEETRMAFYDTWIYEDDPTNVINSKKNAFDNLNIPLEYVTSVSTSVRSTQSKQYGSKSEDQLMQDFLQKTYDDVLFNLEMKVDAFKVVTPLYGRRPLRAKIGLKEGLKTDFRFFVYEHVYNPRTNSTRQVRRGVIRAKSSSKIHDNRHEASGEMGTSQFYQVAGRRLHEGYTLVQRNDFGVEIILAGETGGIGGFYGRADIRTGRFTGIRSFFVYVDLGLDGDDSQMLGSDFTMLRVSGGLAKGMQLTRNAELRSYLGIGVESASNDTYTEDDAIQAYYFRAGINLALNLTHNFQLIGGLGSYNFVTDAENESGTISDVSWTDIFPEREGVSTMIGVKFMF
jgi:hypothetical protein